MAANFKVISSLLNKWKFEPPVFLVLPKIQPWSVLIMFLDFWEFQPYVLINVVLIKKNGVYAMTDSPESVFFNEIWAHLTIVAYML